MKRPVIILLAASAGLAAGFAVRWLQPGSLIAETSPQKNAVSAAVAKTPVPDTSTAPRSRRAMTPLAAELEQRLAVSDGVSRWLEWMAVMEKAKLSDFPDLARLAKGNSVALRMVSARWIELDRQHLFKTLVAEARSKDPASASAFPLSEFGQQLFEEWSKSDPAAAIAALSAPDFPTQMKDMRYTVLNSVMKTDPETGLKTMAAWRVENYGTGTDGIAKWAAANPRHAAEFALAHPAGYTTQTAVEVIGKEWAKTDPAAAMDFAAGMKDRYGAALATGVLRAWATADLAKAAAWLAAADPKVRNRLASPMLEVWAKADTNTAMDWIQENLTGNGRDEAVASVLKGAAETSVANAAGIVTGMDSSTARAKAAASVARKWWPGYDASKPVPPEAVAWLSSLDPASIKHVVGQIQWQWGGSDPKGLAEFLTSPAGQHAPEYAFPNVAREMAQKNPQDAIAWAARLPEGQRDSAALIAFMTWQQAQAPAAMKWLRQLPPEDPRREAWHYALVGQYVSDPGVASSISKSLASGNTAAAQKALQAVSIPDDHRAKLLNGLQLR